MPKPVRRPRRRAVHLILDFDGTITTADTTTLLAQLAAQKAAQSNPNPFETAADAEIGDVQIGHSNLKLRLWEDIVSAYIRDKKTHDEKWTSASGKGPDERTVEEEIHYQRKLEKVERRSFERVRESELFKGMKGADWEVGASEMLREGKVVVREGLQGLVGRVRMVGKGGRVGVVSVNWSENWVKGVLETVLPKGVEVPVLCNEVDGSDGRIIGCKANNRNTILTSPHKLRAMHLVLTQFRHSSSFASQPPLIVYIGDSVTDVQCLLDADVGIIMMDKEGGTPSKVKQIFEKDGTKVGHIEQFGRERRQGYGEKTMWWATNFEEVLKSRLLRDSEAEDDDESDDEC